ncbi:hypothetical protein ACEUDM_18135, partial [Aeromonas caviae]|uniref:hypothetical protein n=1 Tax=Aeromonas caviae TaxID=648 RepID=UPI0038D17C0B
SQTRGNQKPVEMGVCDLYDLPETVVLGFKIRRSNTCRFESDPWHHLEFNDLRPSKRMALSLSGVWWRQSGGRIFGGIGHTLVFGADSTFLYDAASA